MMTYAVRYYSRSGNTKKVADAIAEELGVTAVSVDSSDAALDEKADVLFIGGALYAYGIDKKLAAFLDSLDKDKAGKIVAFTTAMMSKHAVDLIKKAAAKKGIEVQDETLFIKSKAVDANLDNARKFARRSVK